MCKESSLIGMEPLEPQVMLRGAGSGFTFTAEEAVVSKATTPKWEKCMARRIVAMVMKRKRRRKREKRRRVVDVGVNVFPNRRKRKKFMSIEVEDRQ